jgi:transposase
MHKKKAIIAAFKPMEVSYADLAVAHNINKITVRSFVSRYNNGKILRERVGRPCRLDENAVRIIKEDIANNDQINKFELYEMIRQKAAEQWLREHGYPTVRDVPEALLKKMKISRRCVGSIRTVAQNFTFVQFRIS